MTNGCKITVYSVQDCQKSSTTILILRSLRLENEGMGGKKESVHLWGNANVGGLHSFAKQTFPKVKAP